LLPFGAGRRGCPGEALARNRLFLFVAALVQKFNILPGDGKNIPKQDPITYKLGINLSPPRFTIKAIVRDAKRNEQPAMFDVIK